MSAPSLTENLTKEKEKDRIGLRLYNAIVIYDVYMVGKTPEAAREGLLSAIASGELKPSEIVAKEVTMQSSIRESWKEERPWLANDITDEEFETLRGKSTQLTFDMLYKKAK